MGVVSRIREDVANARHRDPAARSNAEVFWLYPGLHAVWAYRIAHKMWQRPALRFLSRALSQASRATTGIEIHPGATIGDRLFIDHGMGVVIGETAELGNDIMLYHGVTLGGRTSARVKRHPTLGDNITVGTGASILGPVVIGSGSVVAAQAVVTRDAPPHTMLIGVPAVAKPISRDDPREYDAGFFVI